MYLLVFQGTGAIAGSIAIGNRLNITCYLCNFSTIFIINIFIYAGLLAEAISGVRINAQLLSEPQYLFIGMDKNPLNWAYYASGLVFLLSALAYAPLRLLSAWESRRYFSKRETCAQPSCYSTHSASPNTPNDMSNQQVRRNDSSLLDGVSVANLGDGQLPLPSSKRKTSVSILL